MTDASNPVVLVHGILGQRHLYWNILKGRLRADGFRYHDCILPYGMLGDMRVAAQFLRDKVEAALRHDDARRVDLVCHSAGGLVARYYLMFLDGYRHVDRVVFLGTPHQGTYFSYASVPLLQIAQQARPGSHFLREVGDPGAQPDGVRFYNLWSPIDGIVWPHHHARLPGSTEVRLPWTTHWGFLWRRDVYETVRDCLTGE